MLNEVKDERNKNYLREQVNGSHGEKPLFLSVQCISYIRLHQRFKWKCFEESQGTLFLYVLCLRPSSPACKKAELFEQRLMSVGTYKMLY